MSAIRPYTKQLLLFFDFETTGLIDRKTGEVPFILETGLAVFDVESWSVVAEESWPSYPLTQEEILTKSMKQQSVLISDRLDELPDPVREMHEESGLYQDTLDPHLNYYDMRALNHIVTDLVKSHITADDQEVYLAGSGISEFDRPIIDQHLPDLSSILHYRSIDFGVFRRVMAFLGHEIPWGEPPFDAPVHRALPDVHQSIAQMQWFKDRTKLEVQ